MLVKVKNSWVKVYSEIFIQHKFLLFSVIISFFEDFKVFKPIQHFIQRVIISMLDEMLDWLAPVFA